MQEVISSIESQRDDNEVFPQLVAKMKSLLGEDLQKPRVTSRQTQRSNYDAEEAEEYYRVSLYLPYIDHLLSDLKRRFESSPSVARGELLTLSSWDKHISISKFSNLK